MKTILKYFSFPAVALTAVALLSSCSMEEPFGVDGEGNLSLTTQINGDVIRTRAGIEPEELARLEENCVVYIENNKGVIRKYKGVNNIPSTIRLQTGSYVAEAWSGDSVSASFDQKFYRGYQDFDIKEGENSLTLKCNIANVLVSVDPTSLNVDLSDLKVTFSHSRGSLEFTEETIADGKKGYFMMPNADKDLGYKIEGVKLDGQSYVKEGTIPGVQRAHEYCMTITANQHDVTEGGAMITITIADIPLIEETVEIFPGPSVKGIGFNIEEQVSNLENNFDDVYVYAKAYGEMSSLNLSFSDNFTDSALGNGNELNILSPSIANQLAEKGISYQRKSSVDAASDGSDVTVDEVILCFSRQFLNTLAKSDTEYCVAISAVDKKHREAVARLRVANSPDAVEVLYPVSSVPVDTNDLLAVGARSATVPGLVNDLENAENYGIMYHKQGDSQWLKAYADVRSSARTRATSLSYSVRLTGLEPNTVYEYKSFCDGYESPAVMTFRTEDMFKIPNASFEEWGTYGNNIVVPGSTGDKSTCYWGSGNEGSALANLTLTNKYEDLVRTGKYSAKLASNKALGVLAAGNIFTGEFSNIKNLKYGVIKVGRQFNGTHPSKVRVYCNYRPGSVDCTASQAPLSNGDTDHGQIYIGLVTEPLSLDTYTPSTLFTPENYKSKLIAYGQVTLTENYGANNELKELDIPFEYYDMAKTVRPAYIVIVATASKYGDYYAGSSKSVMILDDVELVYE